MLAINPATTRVLICAYPDMQCNVSIPLWLARHGWPMDDDHVVAYAHRHAVAARNRAIRDLALASDKEHFVFLEKDVVPCELTDPFLEVAGDFVACRYRTEADEHAWHWPHAFHTGIWRCSRQVLERTGPPWFTPYAYNREHTDVLKCTCATFAERVVAAGFEIVRAGVAIHDPSRHCAKGIDTYA